jgi:hypothetical protein
MATVLVECSLWTKELNAKSTHKEMFPVNGGKHLLHKTIHNWVEKFSHGRLKVADDEMEVQKWLRQQQETSVLRVLTH